MRHAWTEDQVLLRSMVSRYVADEHCFEKRQKSSKIGFDSVSWRQLAELGLLGLTFAETDGGAGGSALDLYLVMEALGAGLVTAPYLPSVILAGGLIRHLASDAQKSQLIPSLTSGDARLAFGFAEPQSRFNLANVSTQARADGDHFVLNGQKSVVYGAPDAGAVFVTARTAGAQSDPIGCSMFLVSANAPGVSLQSYHCIDGMAAADISLRDVRVSKPDLFGPLGEALPAVERVIDEATAAICAEAVGIMDALNAKCLEYARTRVAFGKPIADFQVIQHRLVDMHIACEIAAAAALKAAGALAQNVADCRRTVSACKAQVGEEAAFIGKAAVQLHGAIGITDELDIGHYFKRLMAIQTMFGSTDYHIGRFMRTEQKHFA